MNKEQLQAIYDALDLASKRLEDISKQTHEMSEVLRQIREELASGGGPGEEHH